MIVRASDTPDADTAPGVRWEGNGLGWRGVDIARVREPGHADFESPPHNAMTIVLITSGTYVVESARTGWWDRAVMSPGRLAVTAPGRDIRARWNVESSSPLTSLHVRIDAGLLDPGANSADHLCVIDDAAAGFVRALDTARRRRSSSLHAQELAVRLAALMGRTTSAASPASRRALPASAMRDVIDYMHANVGADIDLDDLASITHLSRYHFSRRFAESAGTSPMRLFTEIRMARACVLLTDSTLPISEVGYRIGYDVPSAFSAAFRRVYGATPTTVRAEADAHRDDADPAI